MILGTVTASDILSVLPIFISLTIDHRLGVASAETVFARVMSLSSSWYAETRRSAGVTSKMYESLTGI